MALYVSTVSANVVLDDLGFTVVHPTSNFDIEGQFGEQRCAGSSALTTAIQSGLLSWTRVSGGASELASEYSPIGAPDIQDEGVDILKDIQTFNFAGANAKTTKTKATSVSVKFLQSCQAEFVYLGNGVGTRYLCSYGTTSPTSDTVPFVCPQGMVLVGLMYQNTSASANVDIQIYKNAALTYTWQDVRAKRWAVKNSKTALASFAAGDRISVRHLNNSGTATNVKVVLFFVHTDDADVALTGTTV